MPTWFEAGALFLLTAAVVIIGNTRNLLDFYGLSGSKQVIQQGAGQAISTGLSRLDGFSLTGRIVTFLVWAVVGALCFSMAQVIGRIYHEFEEEQQVSSNRFVHPATFTKVAFWGRVLLNFIGTMFGLALLAVGLYCLLAYVLPIALTYTSMLLTDGVVSHVGTFVVGYFMLYGWILVLTVILKFVIHRHRLFSR